MANPARHSLLLLALFVYLSPNVSGQQQPVPQPFPTPNAAERQQLESDEEVLTAPVPTEENLGVPMYPNANHLASYAAGRGQTLHIYGTNAGFEEMVRYYRVILNEGGNRVFDSPATHQFDTERFRDEDMTYRPSVTVKDYTWNGAEGYLNPIPGATPARYQTIIQVTTAPNSGAGR